MRKKYKILATLVIIISILSPNIIIIAQELTSEKNPLDMHQIDLSGIKEGEFIDCSDSYKLGTEGIDLKLASNKIEYNPYDLVEISGEITNNNNYPITGLTVRARLFRINPNSVIEGILYTTVDDFEVVNNITLKEKGKYQLQHTYNISGKSPTGEYKINYYLYNQGRIIPNTLSLIESITLSSTEFIVSGGSEHIYLDKSNININGKLNNNRSFIDGTEKGKNIPIKLPLVNPTDSSKEIRISYKLYKWNEIVESNFIEEQSKELTISPNSKIDLEYIANTSILDYPLYYLVITAMPVGQRESDLNVEKTMAHISFGFKDINRQRLNFIGLDKNPFNEKNINMLICIQNINFQLDEEFIKVKSIAKDEKGRELSKIEYQGKLPLSIFGFKNKLNTDKKFNKVTIETNLYNANDELIDNLIINYNCNELSSDSCNTELNNRNIIIVSILILLLILGLVIYYKSYKKLNI